MVSPRKSLSSSNSSLTIDYYSPYLKTNTLQGSSYHKPDQLQRVIHRFNIIRKNMYIPLSVRPGILARAAVDRTGTSEILDLSIEIVEPKHHGVFKTILLKSEESKTVLSGSTGRINIRFFNGNSHIKIPTDVHDEMLLLTGLHEPGVEIFRLTTENGYGDLYNDNIQYGYGNNTSMYREVFRGYSKTLLPTHIAQQILSGTDVNKGISVMFEETVSISPPIVEEPPIPVHSDLFTCANVYAGTYVACTCTDVYWDTYKKRNIVYEFTIIGLDPTTEKFQITSPYGKIELFTPSESWFPSKIPPYPGSDWLSNESWTPTGQINNMYSDMNSRIGLVRLDISKMSNMLMFNMIGTTVNDAMVAFFFK